MRVVLYFSDMRKYQTIISILALFFAITPSFLFAATSTPIIDSTLYNQLKGLIILKVEAKGEAYYVHPRTKAMYYLGRPDDAYAVMRDQGIGITNANLARIPVGSGPATLKGIIDLNFTAKQLGVIFLQVESKGEAWYVYPKDKKRYYLGRPDDAYNIMRTLGLGISNVNFNKLTGTASAQPPGTPANVGYSILDLTIQNTDGTPREIPVSVWYPTDAKPSSYAYDTVGGGLTRTTVTSAVAKNAQIKLGGTYPLLLFLHGDLTCGTQSVFLTEYLASRGFIVVGPDFPDDAQICHSRGGAGAGLSTVFSNLNVIKRADKNQALEMLKRNSRIPGASRIIDQIIALTKQSGSLLYQRVNTGAIGVIGHSYGGETILGLIGSHTDASLKDSRIRAAVILSGAVFPFQETLSNITAPVMVMQGDDGDDLDLHNVPRKNVYDNSRGAKFFLKITNAAHGSFFNGVCASYSAVSDCNKSNSVARAINEYSAAFFQKYLLSDANADNRLKTTDPALKVYQKS